MYFSVATHNNKLRPDSFINYDNVEFTDIPEMVTSGFAYASGKFKNNYRLDSNYEGYEDVLILDIDKDCSLEQAKIIFKKYTHYIITSKSHQIDKNGLVCDRFRVFILLAEKIMESSIREQFMNEIINTFPFVDTACRNSSRFFYSSPKNAEIYYNEAKPMPIISKIIILDGVESKKKTQSISEVRLDEIFVFSEIYECWINKYGETLKDEENDNRHSKLKGATTILDNEFYSGNRNNTVFKVACLLLRDGFSEDEVADFLIKENNSRDSIKFNELMSCIKSAIKKV